MAILAEDTLQEVMAAFDFDATPVGAIRYGQGHINDTFVLHTDRGEAGCHRFILQRISAAAFARPDQLMENIVGVTTYLGAQIAAKGGDPQREALHMLPTRQGLNYFTDSAGGAWRAMVFVEHTRCLQTAQTPQLFYASAVAFGNFQHMLRDYPAHTLHETIANFHDTENRYALLLQAIERDALGRAEAARQEISFAQARAKDCSVAMDALRAGKLPLRVTHNDTKLNNVLMDWEEDRGVCVIDLDTVMPGLSIHDFGDSIRFGANHSAEDEQDLTKVSFDLSLFEVYAKGFLLGAAGSLTQTELEYLPWGAKLMTLECGMRFLTDYLQGDCYFHTTRSGQNLDRCRTQFKLVADMERDWDGMHQVIARLG